MRQLSGLGLVSGDLEEAGCGGPGLTWLHMFCGCEDVLTKFSEMTYGVEVNIPSVGSGGHS